MRALRQVRKPGKLALIADEAVDVAGQAGAEELIAVVPRVVAIEQDSPGRLGFVAIAKRGERDSDLECPAGRGDLAGRVPKEIRGTVFAAGVTTQRVVFHAPGVGQEHLSRLAVIAAIDDDAGIVGRRRYGVVIPERGSDGARRRVFEIESGIEIGVVVGQIRHVLHLGFDVVADVGLVPGGDAFDSLPAGVRKVTIDRDRCRHPSDR